MRALIDYRAALRERSGVGEYAHEVARALLQPRAAERTSDPFELTLFSSSWKDRLVLDTSWPPVRVVDRRVPVGLLNLAWHRLEWPPVERLAPGRFDVVHSMHPLLLPSRHAAQVVTIHDLNFLAHPERTRSEIRRDYPALVRAHAHRADHIITVSEFTARETERLLGVSRDRIAVCSPGAPPWARRERTPAQGHLLFLGTLEPRKNIGALLDAYETLLATRRDAPPLVLAGRTTEESRPWLERIARSPLEGHVRHLGYVDDDVRQSLYRDAILLAQPSFEEGFGLPVLEAMTVGVPVVAADRGALPEVLDGAGMLIDPADRTEFASALARVIDDTATQRAMADAGLVRAARRTWQHTARHTMAAYRAAIAHRRAADGAA